MKLTEAFVHKGLWWRPSNPKYKVAGVLTYTPGDRLLLELIGTFDEDKTQFFNSKNKSEDVIFGVLENAKEVSLLHCFSSFSFNFSCPFPIVKYNCSYGIFGVYINSLDVVSKFRADIKYPELSYWYHPGLISRSLISKDDNKSQVVSFSYNTADSGKVVDSSSLDDGYAVNLKVGINMHEYNQSLNTEIGQLTYLEIRVSSLSCAF